MVTRNRSIWVLLISTVIAVPVLYALSFGPACWWMHRTGRVQNTTSTIYQPILWAWCNKRGMLSKGIAWYANLFPNYDGYLIAEGEDGKPYRLFFIPKEASEFLSP